MELVVDGNKYVTHTVITVEQVGLQTTQLQT